MSDLQYISIIYIKIHAKIQPKQFFRNYVTCEALRQLSVCITKDVFLKGPCSVILHYKNSVLHNERIEQSF